MEATSNTGPVKVRHEQPTALAKVISAAAQEIAAVQSRPELRAALAERGFSAERLAQGMALQAAAQEAYNARQKALAVLSNARSSYRLRRAAALATYRQFRLLAPLACATPGDRTALALSSRLPADTRQLITQMHTAYDAAEQPAFALSLAAAGFGPAQLAAARTHLTAMAVSFDAATLAAVRAAQVTERRNEAGAALITWLRIFRRVVRVASQPAGVAPPSPLACVEPAGA